MSCVSAMKVVGSAMPAKYTTAPFANPLPVTVSVCSAGASGLNVIGFGLTPVIAGVGFCRFTVTLADAVESAAAIAVIFTATGGTVVLPAGVAEVAAGRSSGGV